jgi:hypothetical protein
MANPTRIGGIITNSTRSSAWSELDLQVRPVGTNNCVAIVLIYSIATGTPTFALTDDNAVSYGAPDSNGSIYDGTNTLGIATWVLPGVTGNPRIFTATASGGTCNFGQFIYVEEYNIATSAVLDVAMVKINTSGSTSWALPSMTTVTDGCVIYLIAKDVSGAGTFANFTANGTAATLELAHSADGAIVQRQVQTTHGAITPTVTSPGAGAFVAVAFALKPASAGTLPATPYVLSSVWLNPNDGTTTTWPTQFPVKGDAIHVGWVGASSGGAIRAMNKITDTNGNNYEIPAGTGTGTSGFAQHAYNLSARKGDQNRVTITVTADNLSTAVLDDIVSTGGLTFDKIVNASGFQADGADLDTGTCAASRAGGLIFNALGVNRGTMRKTKGSAFVGSNPWAKEEDGGGNNLHQDNGWSYIAPTDTSGKQFSYTESGTDPGRGVTFGAQDWAAQAISFVPYPPATIDFDYSRFPIQPIAERAQGIS